MSTNFEGTMDMGMDFDMGEAMEDLARNTPEWEDAMIYLMFINGEFGFSCEDSDMLWDGMDEDEWVELG